MKLKNYTLALSCLLAGISYAQTAQPLTPSVTNTDTATVLNEVKTMEITNAGKIDYKDAATTDTKSSSSAKKSARKNPKPKGKQVERHANGQLKTVERYKRGVLNGEKITYYSNGATETIENYENGKLEGERFEYFENGQLSLKTNYKNGELTGFWYSYHNNAAVESYGYYQDGNKVLIFTMEEE